MAIRIIQGVPGSGKTYYAVRHLAENYFEKQEDGRYELVRPCTIITNIDSFQPTHIRLQDAVKNAGGVKNFFTESYQIEYSRLFEYQIIYIIDEAQKLFRKHARDLNDVFTYFELHRHLGHDIYLITQNVKKLPTDLVVLTEYIIDAAPRSRSVIGEFKYKWLSDGEVLKREGFRPDAGIFALYKSMDILESEKISNPVMKTFWVVMCVALLVIGAGVYYFKSVWGGGAVASVSSAPAPAAAAETKAPASAPAPVKPSSPPPVEVVTVRVDHGTVYKRRKGKREGEVIPVTYIFLGRLCFRKDLFPHKIERVLGEYYVTVPRDFAAHAGALPPQPAAVEQPVRRLRNDLSGANAGQAFAYRQKGHEEGAR